MKRLFCCIAIAVALVSAASCAGKQGAKAADERELTLGLVQKNIQVGMSQADVAEALGSPNIVTKDAGELETWIYDKIATQVTSGGHGGYWTLILVGGNWGTNSTTSTQKTLTVVIKFDARSRVKTVSYHASKF